MYIERVSSPRLYPAGTIICRPRRADKVNIAFLCYNSIRMREVDVLIVHDKADIGFIIAEALTNHDITKLVEKNRICHFNTQSVRLTEYGITS